MAGLSVASHFTIERNTLSQVPPLKSRVPQVYAFRRIDEQLRRTALP